MRWSTQLAACVLLAGVPAAAQLRVCTWNVTNYSGDPALSDAFRTVFYGAVPSGPLAGTTMSPDVIAAQEFMSSAGVTEFRNLLNSAVPGINDWQAAPWLDGPDTDGVLFYRSSKVDFLGVTIASVGQSNTPGIPPRHAYRYALRLKGYTSGGATLVIYNSHMKAGSTADDQDKRTTEAQRIRQNAATLQSLYPGCHFLLAADLNIQASTQQAYVELVGIQANNDGRFFDPIARPGAWNNSSTFAVIHTQDPKGSGGMDDRFDQILVSAGLLDMQGFEYVGVLSAPQTPVPASLSSWNDPNHSHRAWGNDGTTFNAPIRIVGNTMVGQTIAQAIWSTIPIPDPVPPTVPSSMIGGHLPVFLDLRVPPRVSSPTVLDFGSVAVGAVAERTLSVTNSGDVALWGSGGIATLNYSLAATPGFAAPSGNFVEPAGGGSNVHTIGMDTSTPGPRSGTLTIHSNAPDQPARVVTLIGTVTASCCIDYNSDFELDFGDIEGFLAAYAAQTPGACAPGADLNGDEEFDFSDIEVFLARYAAGC